MNTGSSIDVVRSPTTPVLTAIPLAGFPEVVAGDDLSLLVAASARTTGWQLADDDVVVLASKVVAKAEGLTVPEADRDRAVREATAHVVAGRELPDGSRVSLVRTRTGHVTANAGVDLSDATPGTALLLPPDADRSARDVRRGLRERFGVAPAVVVTDTSGRPWRDGVVDVALGVAGLRVLDDLRGTTDRHGRVLEVTVRAVADEVASLADLVRGKASGRPAAVVRGLGAFVTAGDGPGARALLRPEHADWFRRGHVEAVRDAVGVPTSVPPPPVRGAQQRIAVRTDRAVRAWRAALRDVGTPVAWRRVRLRRDGSHLVLQGDAVAVGAQAARLLALLTSEDLRARVVEGSRPAGSQAGVALVVDGP